MNTLNKLCEYLLYLGKHETEIEIIRCVLCELENFHPFYLFQHIDTISEESKGKLKPEDILSFLEENGFVNNLQECQKFIDTYDIEEIGYLLYSQFLRICLPQNNQELRQKISLLEPKSDSINPIAAYTLAKLINYEIKAIAPIQQLLQNLQDCSDYNPITCFQWIDTYKTKRLQLNNFKDLFTQSAIIIYPEEIGALFKRLDLLGDGIVDEKEFLKWFKKRAIQIKEVNTPLKEKSYLQNYRDKSIKQKSTTKKSAQSNQSNVTPIKKLNSILKYPGSSPKREFGERSVSFIHSAKNDMSSLNQSAIFQTPNKKYQNQKTELRAQMQLFKVQKTSSRISTQQSTTKKEKQLINKQQQSKKKEVIKKKSIGYNETINIQTFLTQSLIKLLNQEKQIEKLKTELSLQANFSLCDAFRQLDKQKLGFIKIEDFETIVGKMDLEQFYKRYAPDGRLKFTQFINIVEPNQTYYSELLRKKEPIYRNIFSGLTREFFVQLISKHIEKENIIQQIKQEIKLNKGYDIKYLFLLLDEGSNDNLISMKDLDEYLYKQNLQPELEEIALLYNLLDNDGDGQISFPDFIEIFSF